MQDGGRGTAKRFLWITFGISVEKGGKLCENGKKRAFVLWITMWMMWTFTKRSYFCTHTAFADGIPSVRGDGMARALVRWLFGLLVTACCAVVLLGVIERADGRGDAAETAAERLTVAVDAGHGGFDGGAVGVTGVVEAGLNLAVAQEVERLFCERGFSVRMTRTDDEALGATKREDMAARRAILSDAGVDLVVSIHMNKFSDPAVRGAMAYYMQGSAEGEALAQHVIDAVTEATGQKKRGANPGDYFVVRECSAPAVLVECGFLSNAEEETLLADPAYQKRLAAAIVQGVSDYLAAR